MDEDGGGRGDDDDYDKKQRSKLRTPICARFLTSQPAFLPLFPACWSIYLSLSLSLSLFLSLFPPNPLPGVRHRLVLRGCFMTHTSLVEVRTNALSLLFFVPLSSPGSFTYQRRREADRKGDLENRSTGLKLRVL
ncbi:uncharacterized protein BO97DRAFT_114748 [Aspergillus homomorphus CBS 101889]|uniref:Uncharacterized protein n=1 Tax=Aspergillus homomorphus (strain CBS 101889) TaxID=1450537 RepID=A0A395HSP6_ASPHC|nr:hypothetical protein BO97DRAFT_114748 [Aspergillus homomorphus CBS 101889]RAL10847.1 hypothetical protein BO97DRAFT_114748 [Aspergillus homomorphus CBS 101889]